MINVDYGYEALGSLNDEASLLSEDKNTFYKKYAMCRHHKILTQWEIGKHLLLFLRTLFLLKYPLKMPPIPKAMGVGDAIVTYQVSKAGGAFGPRQGAQLEPQNVPQSAVAAPPRHNEAGAAKETFANSASRVTKVWSWGSPKCIWWHQGLIQKSLEQQGRVERIARGLIWFAGDSSIRSISVNTCRRIQQAQV